MESAKRYIDADNAFFLHRINCLDLYLKDGITIFVTEFGSSFHDMTLIQYAIAKRKFNTLKDMLETSYTECQVPLEEIVSPVTSNTKGNLLSLAVEFGSRNEEYGDNYEEADNKCLKVIIDFLKEKQDKELNVDIENINGETPLIRAINLQNVEACQLLIQNGANIFYKSTNNQYIDNPLLYLFKHARYDDLLHELIEEEVLGKDIFSKVYDICKQIYFEESQEKMNEINNPRTKEYFDELFEDIDEPKTSPKKSVVPQQPEPELEEDDDLYCANNNHKFKCNDAKVCQQCQKTFCSECYPIHHPCFDE